MESLNTNGTVMIVDDTPGNLALLSDTLSEAGYRVLVATDGLGAIEQISHLKPDIILMDVMMPGIDGFETCRRLKANPHTEDIPVLFMTGLSELDNLLRGFNEGGLDYIIKPIRPPEVLARIDVHLGLARNKKRSENALNLSTFSALTTDSSGCITWLSPSARVLITEVMNLPSPIALNDDLPEPILTWIKKRIQLSVSTDPDSTEEFQTHSGLSIKLASYQSQDEYLLLLKKDSQDWNLTSLKDALGLTLREVEILMWISRGKTNKEVGLILESSHRTVNKHLEHIFEKLGVTTRAAAVAIVLQRAGSTS
jgi:DNA-binding response OmpR family regulator/DNA-binding CsgD family transcriptional regulator